MRQDKKNSQNSHRFWAISSFHVPNCSDVFPKYILFTKATETFWSREKKGFVKRFNKKPALIKLKIKTICLTKKYFLISYYDNCFLISSAIQELIHHIYCFGKNLCWSHKFEFYDLYLEFYSLNVLNICYSTIHLYICYDLLLQQHFDSHLFLFYLNYCLLPKANISLATIRQILQLQHLLFHLSFFQWLICLNHHSILT